MRNKFGPKFAQSFYRRFASVVIPSPYSFVSMYQVFSVYLTYLRCLTGAAAMLCVILAGSSVVALGQGEDDQVDVVAIFNKAQELHEKGDLTGALKLYERALVAMPEFPEAEFQRGMAYLALGKPDEAEISYRKAIGLRPDWTLAMTGLGVLLVNRIKLAEAEPLLKKVLEIEPQNPPALAAFAEIRLQSKAPAAELQDLLARLIGLTGKAYPTPSIWVTRAALENSLGRSSDARASLLKALELDPKNRNALLQLADLAIVEGDVVRARDILGRLEKSMPAGDPLRIISANILFLESKYDDALAELNSVKVLTPPAVDLQKRIKTVQASTPAQLEKQLTIDEKNANILGRLCSMLRKDAPERALVYCRRASEAEPSNVNHAVGFGAALVQARQFESAVGLFSKLIPVAPDNATARANMATALFQLKRYEEAKTQFNWLASAHPEDAGAFLFLGIIHDELMEYMDAAANYQQYIKLADPVENKLDIEKVMLRLPAVQKLIKQGKGRKK